MADPGALGKMAWVVVGPKGLYYVGLHEGEADTWDVALGWPSNEEIIGKQKLGWYAAQAELTWRKP